MMFRSERAMGLDAVRMGKEVAARLQDEQPFEAAESRPAKLAVAPTDAPKDVPVLPKTGLLGEATAKSGGQRLKMASPIISTPFTAPVLTTEQKRAALEAMDRDEVKDCRLCRLCEARTHTVFGEGNADAHLMFIGEGPGETEDQSGRPFVGRAGELLGNQIVAMGLSRADVFIANIVKCRPPDNRAPAPDETAACTPYLQRQIEIIRPRVIVTLGLPASQYLLQSTQPMGRMRGTWHSYRGIKVMPTYHPAYLLRNYTQDARRAVWNDLQQVMSELGLPGKSGSA